MSQKDSFVNFEKVDKSYDGEVLVVKDLNLDVPKGAVRGIPILSRTLGLIGHLNEEKERPIGFMMSHFGSDPIEYDGG